MEHPQADPLRIKKHAAIARGVRDDWQAAQQQRFSGSLRNNVG
jgi:hypothetical protein